MLSFELFFISQQLIFKQSLDHLYNEHSTFQENAVEFGGQVQINIELMVLLLQLQQLVTSKMNNRQIPSISYQNSDSNHQQLCYYRSRALLHQSQQQDVSQSLSSGAFKKEQIQWPEYLIDQNPESQDSVVSFQQDIITGHLKSSHFYISELTNYIFKYECSSLELNKRNYFLPERPIFSEYLSTLPDLITSGRTAILKSQLSKDRGTFKFIREIFEESPQLLVYELVWIPCKVLAFYSPFRKMNYTEEELASLAENRDFLNIIFTDDHFAYLHASRVFEQNESVSSQYKIRTQKFIRFFVWTCLLVIEGYFQSPFLPLIKQIRRKEMERGIKMMCKNKRSKRIKKAALPVE